MKDTQFSGVARLTAKSGLGMNGRNGDTTKKPKDSKVPKVKAVKKTKAKASAKSAMERPASKCGDRQAFFHTTARLHQLGTCSVVAGV